MPYVGVLFNEKRYWGVRKGRTGKERLDFYEDAARALGMTACYVRLADAHASRPYWMAWVREGRAYVRKRIPRPLALHNRAFYKAAASKKKLRELQVAGIPVFNSWNRQNKWLIHGLLTRDPSVCAHVPETWIANAATVRRMMQRHPSLIVKPEDGSIGRDVLKLDRTDQGWVLLPGGVRVDPNRLPEMLTRRFRTGAYLVQQRLPLADYQGRPFDLRVSVQRGADGQWQVTGMVGKVAPGGSHVTNVGSGGAVVGLGELLRGQPQLDAGQVRQAVENFALRTAESLSLHLPGLADIGLDVGISVYGFPLFIECNFQDMRYSFGAAGMTDAWKATYRNPIAYAHYLIHNRPQTGSP